MIIHLEAIFIPITDEKIEIPFGLRKWGLDPDPIVNSNWAECSTGLFVM